MARSCVEEGGDASRRALSETLQRLSGFHKQMMRDYDDARLTRWRTSLFRQVDPQVKNQFKLFREGIEQVNRYFKDPKNDHLVRGAGSLRASSEALLDLFDELRREEESFPTYSESPYLHRLAYLVIGVADATLPREALAPYLDWFSHQTERAVVDLKSYLKGAAENAAVAETTNAMEAPLKAMAASLAELRQAYKKESVSGLKAAKDKLLEQGKLLAQLHKQLLERLAPSVACPRCGASSPPGSRQCTACSSRLPSLPGGPPSSLDMMAGPAPSKPRFAYVVRLEEAVAAYLDDPNAFAQLSEVLDWFAGNVRQASQALKAAKAPDSYPSPELQAQSEKARALLEEGGRMMDRAVEDFEAFQRSRERSALERGLEGVLAGADKIGESQQLLK
ncbi:MAG: zinc ribbon domain-containing protein [Candidatus Eremiobacteraeota bacterium]|nr:zinc ribbon domain-containing protein [Candidatus Eremiobacteraeota bacterium]